MKWRETIVAVPSKADRAKLTTAQPQSQKQKLIRKGAGVAALQGIAAAVGIASILMSFVYLLIKSTESQEPYVQPT